MKKIVIISKCFNHYLYLDQNLLINFQELNYKIYLLSNKDEFDNVLRKRILKKNNINYKFYYLNRINLILLNHIFVYKYFFFLLKIKPNLVLSFTIKPVIYCGLIIFLSF